MSQSTIDLSALTLNTAEAEDESKVVFEKVYAKPALDQSHAIQTGVQYDTQIPFFGLLGDVGVADSGCGAQETSEQIAASEKTWSPKSIGFRMAHCQADVSNLFKIWKKNMIAKNQFEDMDGGQKEFILQRATDAMFNSILRHTSFGDTAAALIGDGGKITAGKTLGLINVIDGLWKQVETAVSAGSSAHVNITENEEATKVAQLALGASTAYDTLKAMYEAADSRLLEQDDKVYLVTRSLHSNLESYLESKNLNAGFLERTENGKGSGLTYRGIPLVIRDDWDRNIKSWLDNGTTYDNPHRALLTSTGNIPIGTSDEDSLKSLDMFYDKKDREHYIDATFRLDVKLLEEYLLVAAY